MSYQEKTGPLMANSHPGSYCGQDAYSDMFVTENRNELLHRQRTIDAAQTVGESGSTQLHARSTGNYRGGTELETVVRRLTPTECERLQGFPDGWTDIGEWTDSKGKVRKTTDSARYKALGNSIAVGYTNNQSGFWMWLMKRISAEYERSATLGSLFDGISGFPLAWARYNGAENCRWASEIEDFPIAVCRYHFGDEDLGIEGGIRKYL